MSLLRQTKDIEAFIGKMDIQKDLEDCVLDMNRFPYSEMRFLMGDFVLRVIDPDTDEGEHIQFHIIVTREKNDFMKKEVEHG
jgi:hypothetical protein